MARAYFRLVDYRVCPAQKLQTVGASKIAMSPCPRPELDQCLIIFGFSSGVNRAGLHIWQYQAKTIVLLCH